MTTAKAQPLIDYMVAAGRALLLRAGHITDIGVKKQFLTEEDLRIERDIKSIIASFPEPGLFYAEEENDTFVDASSLWVVDPISGTKLFIEGQSHYAIVASHLTGGQADFAAVYDPSADRLYTADRDGLRINGQPPSPAATPGQSIIFAPSYASPYGDKEQALRQRLEAHYTLVPSQGSFALNYCLVAEGRFGGLVSLTKDAFPEFAGCFIAHKAGLRATNLQGESCISPYDRAFVCGTQALYDDLLRITREVIG